MTVVHTHTHTDHREREHGGEGRRDQWWLRPKQQTPSRTPRRVRVQGVSHHPRLGRLFHDDLVTYPADRDPFVDTEADSGVGDRDVYDGYGSN